MCNICHLIEYFYYLCRLVKRILGNGLVLSEGMTHAVHKRLMSPAFNRTSTTSKQPIIMYNRLSPSACYGQLLFYSNQLPREKEYI